MARVSVRPILSLTNTQRTLIIYKFRGFASARESSVEEIQAARKWLEKLHADAIPQSVGELSFSRSSGPGGQNVNKVNSKATLKVPLDALLKHVPSALHSEIRSSRYVAPKSNAVIIQADDSRKQSDNAQSCYARLHQVVVEAGRVLPGETSAAQAERVKNLQKADNERRVKTKKLHGSKKNSRKSRGDD
ncbi:peptidyl-tRNA hydrolase domain-containing protein [Amniculicola lignicola CBS 123094]|uniref:Peptidyl-tRNA hydrolase domain-containing protein n=1 Tax=Amniculicola lignicola CBS 123094 TaxID=1392246 RepID=A0A6A5WEZ4_9PLEO|nr:peptidyl-tRNA hydrolase domain-containing protein [Amniculicola lignicola CBS 123094]